MTEAIRRATFEPVIEVWPGPIEVGVRVAALITDLVAATPHAAIGLPTGSTPGPTYAALRAVAASRAVDFSGLTVFLLDEYVGLASENPQSYRSTIRREVTNDLGIAADRVFGPAGDASDPEEACQRYEEQIAAAGGIALQLLGIGRNGHIGFNEPGTAFGMRTHVTELSEDTREDNARFFDSLADVPTHALTQGPATILNAGRSVLIATGAAKASAVARAFVGAVSVDCPASVLRTHPDVRVVVDTAAAAALPDSVPRVVHGAEG